MELNGKVTIVTGAAVGIGREIAVRFAERGAKVAINYSRSESEAKETLEAVEKLGAEGILVKADVSNEQDVATMVGETVKRFGTVDILINNAAITEIIPLNDLESISTEIWKNILDVNLNGTFFCSKAVSRVMREKGSGIIINIASLAGLRPIGSSIPYCVSKAGVVHLTKCLAVGLAPEIRVNCIAPGPIEKTRWNERMKKINDQVDLEAVREQNIQECMLKCIGGPNDIADAALFFASSSHYITGSILPIDGGRSM